MAGRRDIAPLLQADKDLKYGFGELTDEDLGLISRAGELYDPDSMRAQTEEMSATPGSVYFSDGQGFGRYLSPAEGQMLLKRAMEDPQGFTREYGVPVAEFLSAVAGRGVVSPGQGGRP